MQHPAAIASIKLNSAQDSEIEMNSLRQYGVVILMFVKGRANGSFGDPVKDRFSSPPMCVGLFDRRRQDQSQRSTRAGWVVVVAAQQWFIACGKPRYSSNPRLTYVKTCSSEPLGKH